MRRENQAGENGARAECVIPSGYMEEANCRKCGKPMEDHSGIRPKGEPPAAPTSDPWSPENLARLSQEADERLRKLREKVAQGSEARSAPPSSAGPSSDRVEKIAAYIWAMSSGIAPEKYAAMVGKARSLYDYHAEQIIALAAPQGVEARPIVQVACIRGVKLDETLSGEGDKP